MATFQVPPGVKDYLPGQAGWKREMENKLAQLFAGWGYQEVLTPTFEYYQALNDHGSGLDEELFYKFIDRQGKILALRADMTTPIARMVSSRMKEHPLPLRLFYTANVFRYEKTHAGRQREFFQAGVELIGATGPRADAEVLSLAVTAMEAAGLENYRIGVGQAEVTKALLGQMDRETAAGFKRAMASKDLVEMEALMERYRIPARQRDVFMEVTMSQGGISTVEKLLGVVEDRRSAAALKELKEVFLLVDYMGLADKIFFDLGIFRDIDYYTGIVFEGYVPKLGFPVCGGGRYDNLLERFGAPAAATGFALGLERVMLALEELGQGGRKGYLLAAPFPRALLRAQELRRQGKDVEVCFEDISRQAAEQLAEKKGRTLVYEGEGQ